MEPRFEGSLCVRDTHLAKQTCGGRLKGHEADKHQQATDGLFVHSCHIANGAGYFITDAAVLVRGGFACMSAYKNGAQTAHLPDKQPPLHKHSCGSFHVFILSSLHA